MVFTGLSGYDNHRTTLIGDDSGNQGTDGQLQIVEGVDG